MNNTPAITAAPNDEKINWIKSIPFFLVHLACFGAIWTGVHLKTVLVAVGLYYARMIVLTIAYHRYFSHRTFKTSRWFQFVLAVGATLSAQKGVLWWAAHHRHHHRESDQVADIHSPVQKGFWFSHVGWILCDKYEKTRLESIKDFARFPELMWLDKWPLLPPTLLGVAMWWFGGWEMLVVGFLWSTVALWHGTFTINSLSHVFGRRRYKTTDTSRNNWLLALITCGEGWHNNHHYHQNTANQGWFWWEYDISFYVLKIWSWMGLVKDLRLPSEQVKFAHLKYTAEERAELARGGLVLKPTGRLLERAEAATAKAKSRISDAIAAASEALPPAAPAPTPMLKRQ